MSETFDDVAVTITAPGMDPIHTTAGAVKAAGKNAKRLAQHQAAGTNKTGDTPMFEEKEMGTDDAGADVTVAADELLQIVERIERLEEEKATIMTDIKELFAEAKGRGFDTKALRAIVKLRKKDPNERAEEEAILDLYKNALGMP